eukprot:CAMPEP_0115270206 /NCGR_PEP_ID=MMETSP0270-20121206/53448_1 /TAXON_ID=71861 /ORGANISM="Scrippsiella trochoidea, Strain CCMP3099" /LENGTH=97 /DNA_ID=CAMNT_0002686495 /DNA_START=199 /DNA_END=492 /DNA_ORIENTATION=-
MISVVASVVASISPVKVMHNGRTPCVLLADAPCWHPPRLTQAIPRMLVKLCDPTPPLLVVIFAEVEHRITKLHRDLMFAFGMVCSNNRSPFHVMFPL